MIGGYSIRLRWDHEDVVRKTGGPSEIISEWENGGAQDNDNLLSPAPMATCFSLTKHDVSPCNANSSTSTTRLIAARNTVEGNLALT